MAISTLTIDIVAKMASLERDMGKVVQLSERTAGRINSAFSAAGSVIAASIAGIGLASVVQGFRSVVDQLDALNDAADATGSSIENLSALEDIGKRTGASFESVTSTLVKFNSVLKDADGKNGVSQALKAIGLNAEELKRIDPAEALRQTAVALSQFADDGNKARLVQELFGKSVKDAAPFLKDLAESGKLNATVTSEQAAEAEKFNKQLFTLNTNIGNVGRSIASTLVPALNELFESTRGFFDRVEKRGILGAFGDDLDAALKQGRIDTLNEQIKSLKVSLDDLMKDQKSGGNLQFQAQRIGVLREEISKLQGLLDKEQKITFPPTGAGGGRGVINPDVVKPTLSAAPLATTRQTGPTSAAPPAKDQSAARYIEQLNEQIQKLNQLTTLQEAEAKLQGELSGKTTLSQAEKIRSLAAEIDKKEALADIDKYIVELTKEKADAEKLASEEAARYYEASLTPADELAEKLKRINELYESGAFGGDSDKKRAAAIKAANDEFTAQDENLRKLNSTASEFSNIMLSAIQNGDDLGKALEQIALKAFIFDPLSDALSGLFKGAMGGGGAGGGGILGIVGSLFGGFFAEGGSPPVGKVSVVGERGPELFVPKSAGTIIPNKALGGQAVNITQQISIGEGVSANGVMSAMQAAKEMAKAEVMQILRGRGMPV